MELPPQVSLRGAGMFSTTLQIRGSINGINAVSAGPRYFNVGEIRDLTVDGGKTGLKGVFAQYCCDLSLNRVKVSGFMQQGIYLNYTIMSRLNQCQIINCGGPDFAEIEVDRSTTFKWDGTYVATGNPNAVAGFRLDRTVAFTLIGGAIESCGIPLQLGSKTETRAPVEYGTILALDLENPKGCYMEAGYGWQGTPGQGVRRVTFLNVNGSISGSTNIPFGVKLMHTDALNFQQCLFNQPSSSIAHYWLEGPHNHRTITGIEGVGDAIPRVIKNNVPDKTATPHTNYLND